jgi:hypothetical protein
MRVRSRPGATESMRQAGLNTLTAMHGFVAIQHPERYSLPLGAPGPDAYTQIYGVSMYHQFHCLVSRLLIIIFQLVEFRANSMIPQIAIREIFWGTLIGKFNVSDCADSNSMLNLRINLHTDHCFDCLRQAIQCAGDTTLEGVNGRVVPRSMDGMLCTRVAGTL